MQGPVTFDPQQSFPPAYMMDVRASSYAAPLETVAPGIVELIENTQAIGEAWPGTLTRLVTQIDATDEQRAILTEQANRAENGMPPMAPPEAANPPANKGGVALLGLGALLLLGV